MTLRQILQQAQVHWLREITKAKLSLAEPTFGLEPTQLSTLILTGCESIHLEAVLVPQYRYRGSNASLLCKYELEPNEELFSLKWYKEDTEFYRHTPPDPLSQPPPMTTYG